MNKVEKYYNYFYGKTYHEMSDAVKQINYDYVSVLNRKYFVYLLEWGNHYNYIGCTGRPPHKRFKQHCSYRGLDETKVKMTLLDSFNDQKSALEYEKEMIIEYMEKKGNQNQSW